MMSTEKWTAPLELQALTPEYILENQYPVDIKHIENWNSEDDDTVVSYFDNIKKSGGAKDEELNLEIKYDEEELKILEVFEKQTKNGEPLYYRPEPSE